MNLTETIVEFCRFVRDSGLAVGSKETLSALRAAQTTGIADRELFKFALRAVLCVTKEEWNRFDTLFESFWGVAPPADPPLPYDRRQDSAKVDRKALLFGSSGAEQPAIDDGGHAVSGASAFEQIKQTDFAAVPHHDQAAFEQVAMRLLRQMSLRLSRRLQSNRPSGQIDLRRTIRRNISRGGDLLNLLYRWKKYQPSRLVIFLDISGSMNLYSLFLVRFAYTLQKHFRRVDTFVFSTVLVDITDALKTRDLPAAFRSLSRQAAGWSGGTKIGESLAEFNRRYGRGTLSRDTLFIILSDGWETGEPETLARELQSVKQRVRKVIWLNPLMGMADYQPITRGMSAALPYIDVFAPAHNLESLLALERHLARASN